MSTDIERSVAEMEAAGMTRAGAAPNELRDLAVTTARSLEGIELFGALETLSLIGCSVGDYSPLSELQSLRVLEIRNSDLVETGWVTDLRLQVAVLRRNRVRDGRPVVGLPTLQVLDLSGNPLDHRTREAAVAVAEASNRVLTLDDEDTAELNVLLADAGTGIVSYRVGEVLWACATGLDLVPHPEAGHVMTTPKEVLDVARGSISPGRFLGLDASDEAGGGR
ncbi:hypothetical protein [Kocuria sabuli]|uniref:hypothetical protein n=1 Tax=Kocuria sabuli TaxID=3071448 RepID=UPI0034D3B277